MKKFKKIVISAGPTREKIDPVRFLSNRSSGKMGYAIAENAVDFAEKLSESGFFLYFRIKIGGNESSRTVRRRDYIGFSQRRCLRYP